MSGAAGRLIPTAATTPKIAKNKIHKPAVRDPEDGALAGAVVPAAAGSCTVNVVDTALATGSTV